MKILVMIALIFHSIGLGFYGGPHTFGVYDRIPPESYQNPHQLIGLCSCEFYLLQNDTFFRASIFYSMDTNSYSYLSTESQ